MECWIAGLGWATPAGFGQGTVASESPLVPGILEVPKRKQVFEKPDMRFGRLDEFSRIGLAAIALCLRDADSESWEEKRPIGIVAASRYGCLPTDLSYLETMIPDRGKLASPNLFAYTLPNCFLGEAALRFGLTGSAMVLNQKDPTGLAALRYALEDLTWSPQQGVLAGICDLNPPSELNSSCAWPGGLFLLLNREPGGADYGRLTLENGQLSFSGNIVQSLDALICDCIKNET